MEAVTFYFRFRFLEEIPSVYIYQTNTSQRDKLFLTNQTPLLVDLSVHLTLNFLQHTTMFF